MSIYVEGLDDCLKSLDKLPQEVAKDVTSAGRKAGKEVSKQIRSVTPERFRKLVKTAAIKNIYGETVIVSGLRNKKEKKDTGRPKEAYDWFKAYYNNYGTLTRRDPSHEFDYPPKGGAVAERRRNKVGVPHQNWFERAGNLGRTFKETFLAELKKKGYEW